MLYILSNLNSFLKLFSFCDIFDLDVSYFVLWTARDHRFTASFFFKVLYKEYSLWSSIPLVIISGIPVKKIFKTTLPALGIMNITITKAGREIFTWSCCQFNLIARTSRNFLLKTSYFRFETVPLNIDNFTNFSRRKQKLICLESMLNFT